MGCCNMEIHLKASVKTGQSQNIICFTTKIKVINHFEGLANIGVNKKRNWNDFTHVTFFLLPLKKSEVVNSQERLQNFVPGLASQ